MLFIPAIDLKDNKCVRLRKGKEEDITIFNDNPLEQAIFFEANGCERIHIVDLDAAFGRPQINRQTILNIRKKTNIDIELGGGIKNENDIIFWLENGINFLIVGSLAVKNKELIASVSKRFKNSIYVALDILNKRIMIKGWEEESKQSTDNILSFYNIADINGYIITDISRDGMLKGLDLDLFNNFLFKTKKKIIIGGGLSSYSDLNNIKNNKELGYEGVIAGKAFYSGNIEIKKAINILKDNA